MAESKLRSLALQFAVDTVRLCETVRGHSFLIFQLESSAASIGARINEAGNAQGTASFIASLELALEDCSETEYWLELFARAELADKTAVRALTSQCATIRRILISSIGAVRGNRPPAGEE